MNEVIILRGLPGSGKTDLANSLHEVFESANLTSTVVCADDYFCANGSYKFDFSKIRLAHEQCKSNFIDALNSNTDRIIVSNTNTTTKEFKEYIYFAEKYGYKIRSLVVENRHGNESIHNVPEDTMDKMENRFTIKLR